jgi:hypothetical protein
MTKNGVEMLMQAADHDPRLIDNIRPVVTAFARRHAASGEAQRLQAIIEDWARVADLAIAERNTLSATSQLLPNELDDASLGEIRGCLPNQQSMNSARLVRKSVSRWVGVAGLFRHSRYGRRDPARGNISLHRLTPSRRDHCGCSVADCVGTTGTGIHDGPRRRSEPAQKLTDYCSRNAFEICS